MPLGIACSKFDSLMFPSEVKTGQRTRPLNGLENAREAR